MNSIENQSTVQLKIDSKLQTKAAVYRPSCRGSGRRPEEVGSGNNRVKRI
jgi:hypothetical protein